MKNTQQFLQLIKTLIIGRSVGDSVIANAMLDRVLHHCKVFQIIGPSYRMKGKEDLFKDD